MNNLVSITLHGHLGEAVGHNWNLNVKSVKEAVHAINVLSKGKLNKHLLKQNEGNAEYRFLINQNPVKHHICSINKDNAFEICNTELAIENPQMQSIDIVPVIEGAEMNQILGGILIVAGIILVAAFGLGVPVLLAAITLAVGGVAMLLSTPPKFSDFRNIQGGGGHSYFFGGGINITQEGGPVPLGYGEAVVGSQVISAGYSIGIIWANMKRTEDFTNLLDYFRFSLEG